MTDISALEKNLFITKKIFFCFFLLIVFFVPKTQAIPLNVSICTDKDYVHKINGILAIKCNKEILDGQPIHIDSVKKMHAAVQVGNLVKVWEADQESAHERLQIHWIFHSEIPQTDTRNFGKEGTFYESQDRGFISPLIDKFSIAEDMYENSSLKIFWSAVEVLVSLRNDYRTHSSNLIDKNFHIGKWEVKIFEIGKVVDGKKEKIFGQEFEIVK